VNSRAFRCDVCNYEMCADCDYMIHEQHAAYAGHYRSPIIVETTVQTEQQEQSYIPQTPSKSKSLTRQSFSQSQSQTQSYPEQQPPTTAPESKGTGSLFPPDEYCTSITTSEPWIKKAFFYYQHTISGEKTEQRPTSFQTPPSSPHTQIQTHTSLTSQTSPSPAPPPRSSKPNFIPPTPPPSNFSHVSTPPMSYAPPGLPPSLPPPQPELPPFDDNVEPPPSFGAPPMAPPMDESVVAPPMDDAPMAPDLDLPTSSSGGGGGSDDIFAAIRKGPNLKKTTSNPAPVKTVDSRDQLLEDIRKGRSLKSPTPTTPAKTESFQENGGGLAKALEKSLANYRKFVEDDGNDDEEEGEFADAEWGD